ncbi:MAG: N-acetylmuramoyl-L-alanine amidase [Desulfobaccales bacterium]
MDIVEKNEVPKPVIKQFIESPYHSSRGGAQISKIILHYTDSGNVNGTIDWFKNNPKKVSAHYIVDKNGDIYQMVRDSYVANHCKGDNLVTIGIEHVASPGDQLTHAQEQASVTLIMWLMIAYNIPRDKITGHRFDPDYNGGGTDCPDCLFGEPTLAALRAWVDKHFA